MDIKVQKVYLETIEQLLRGNINQDLMNRVIILADGDLSKAEAL